MKSKHDIIWLESTDSTNKEAARRISDLDNLSVVSAFRQTSGRGQRGNKWVSAPGENLTFSIVLKHPVEAYDQFTICELASLCAVDLLSGYGLEGTIKWPNDIYSGGKKIGGILIENSIQGDTISHSIIGVGLNVNQCEFDPSIPNPTSFALESGGPGYDIRQILEEYMDVFTVYFHRYMNNRGGYGRLRRMYLSMMWKLGEESEYIDFTGLPKGHLEGPTGADNAETALGKKFKGTIIGVSDVGNLLVKDHTNDSVREFGFKEIGFLA